jgi:hypothetical protein
MNKSLSLDILQIYPQQYFLSAYGKFCPPFHAKPQSFDAKSRYKSGICRRHSQLDGAGRERLRPIFLILFTPNLRALTPRVVTKVGFAEGITIYMVQI